MLGDCDFVVRTLIVSLLEMDLIVFLVFCHRMRIVYCWYDKSRPMTNRPEIEQTTSCAEARSV